MWVIIRGRILDNDTEEPISGVEYISSKNGIIYAITNNLGYYHNIWNPEYVNDTLRLAFVKKGYTLLKYDTILSTSKGSIVYLPDLKMKKNK